MHPLAVGSGDTGPGAGVSCAKLLSLAEIWACPSSLLLLRRLVYLWEHRAIPHHRRLSLHLIGE